MILPPLMHRRIRAGRWWRNNDLIRSYYPEPRALTGAGFLFLYFVTKFVVIALRRYNAPSIYWRIMIFKVVNAGQLGRIVL
jgi:hypothetical protein